MGEMKFKAAVVQMDCGPDPNANLEKGLQNVREATENGAGLVCLPELFVLGYYLTDASNKTTPEQLEALKAVSKELGVGVVAGLPEKNGSELYNDAVFVDQGQLLARYRKINLFPGLPIPEADVFEKGNALEVADSRFGKLGLQVCFDLRFPNQARELAKNGAELLFYPTAWGRKRADHFPAMIRSRAIENQCFVLAASRCGEDDAPLSGYSRIVDPWGTVLAEAGINEETILYADIDVGKVAETRKDLPLW